MLDAFLPPGLNGPGTQTTDGEVGLPRR